MNGSTSARVGAILLAGGRATRMGGVTKPLLELGGRSLLQRAVDAVRECDPVTVAAEVLDPGLAFEGPARLEWVREEPPFSGPAAAVAAVLAAWRARGASPLWAFLLAGDLAHPDAAVAALRTAAVPDMADGVLLVDDEGREQWLAGLYRVDALHRAAAGVPEAGFPSGARGASMRALMGDLELVRLPAERDAVADIDTWQDLTEARLRAVEEES